MRRTLCLSFVSLFFSLHAPAEGDREAKELFLRGKQHYAAGRFEEAISAFKGAGRIRPSPLLDYNIGRCHEKLKQFAEAIASYKRYLAAAKDAPNRDEVLRWISALKEQKKASKRPRDPYEDLERTPASAPASRPAVPAAGAIAGGTAVSKPAAPTAATRAPARAKEPVHEAADPRSWSEGQGAPATPAAKGTASAAPNQPKRPAAPPPLTPPRPKDEGPFYKQWWFWVACVGGAVIGGFVIAVAASSKNQTAYRTGGLQVHF
jgi:tetratricopeptide (TPR) repeat protein